jgi:hypothetical protein
MTIVKDGEVVAFYLADEVVCSSCALTGTHSHPGREKSLQVEGLEGVIDGLWCDRCGAGIFSFS